MTQQSELVAQRMITRNYALRNLVSFGLGVWFSVLLINKNTWYGVAVVVLWVMIVIMALLITWKTATMGERSLSGKRFEQFGFGYLSGMETTRALLKVALHRWRWWLLFLVGLLPGLIIGSTLTVHDLKVTFTNLCSSDSVYQNKPDVSYCNPIPTFAELDWMMQLTIIGLGMFGVTLLAMILGARFEWARLMAVLGTGISIFAVWTCATSQNGNVWPVAALFPYVLCGVFLRQPRRKNKKLPDA